MKTGSVPHALIPPQLDSGDCYVFDLTDLGVVDPLDSPCAPGCCPGYRTRRSANASRVVAAACPPWRGDSSLRSDRVQQMQSLRAAESRP